MKHTLTLDFQTARLNALLTGHWRGRARLKKSDRELVAAYAKQQGVPTATGKRRVTLTVVLGPGQPSGDSDGWPKSLLDSLVCCGLLVDDSPRWAEMMLVAYTRGPRRGMVVTLEDLQ